MLEFRCPHCSAPLRARDATLTGRPIPCPDCRQSLLLEVVDGVPRSRPAVTETPALPDLSRKPGVRTPVRVAVAAAVAVTVGLLASVRFFSPGGAAPPPDNPPATNKPSPVGKAGDGANVAAPPVNKVELQLQGIHQLIAARVEETGVYPTESASGSGFGWIAEIARRELPTIPFDDRRPWNSPGNDDFVRRRFPAFENPEIPRTPGEDGLPATHFVGLSGVGPDADRLPKSDPRAGIFGTGRITERSDVKDGLANTILIAGVQDQFGSWARADRATVRGFEREPYVNGPDGFGTGQPDGMFVLMADGSVRFISRDIDPIVARRLAAMADGLSLDPGEPGDPLTMKSGTSGPGMSAAPTAAAVEEDAPLTVELAEDAPTFDIERRLNQTLASYALSMPMPLKSVLFELEELLGVPIETTGIPAEMLDRPVTATVADGTVRDLLTAILKSASLDSQTKPDRIVLKPGTPE